MNFDNNDFITLLGFKDKKPYTKLKSLYLNTLDSGIKEVGESIKDIDT